MGGDDAICEDCGYDLSGLGMRGHCPECGRYFDTLTGEGLSTASGSGPSEQASERYRRGERLVRRLGMWFMILMALGVLSCGGIFALFVDDWRYPMATAGIVALIFGLSGLSWYLGDDSDR